MKNLRLKSFVVKFTALCFIINIGFSCAQNVFIPDPIFKAALLTNAGINTNSDTEIQVSEAAAFTGTINVNNLGISSLIGIGAFVNLTELYCRNNQLASLSVTSNTQLTSLYCGYNQITALDLSNLTSLQYLDALFNQLTYLNFQNGNNSSIQDFDVTSNPNLTCILVDDTAYMNANWFGYIDATCSFNVSCGPCIVNIPDPAFKAALLGDLNINTNQDTEIQCSEADAYAGSIQVSNLGITDLTGIEAFVNIDSLDCRYNALTSIDVSSNTALSVLLCSINSLSYLDVNSNANLAFLDCSTNQLDSIRMTGATALSFLDCRSNLLSNIDVSANTALTDLNCSSNQLSSLDITNNSALQYLDCGYNQLPILNVINNPLLYYLDCGSNLLTSLNLASNTAMSDLRVFANQLTNLNVSNLTNLHGLHATTNQITSLNLTANTSLTFIDCSLNPLSYLNIQNGNNTNLTFFSALNDSSLTCVQVDDILYMNINWMNAIESWTSFDTICACIVNIPDANFKAALVGDVLINTNQNNEIECAEAAAYTGSIILGTFNIADLTGIEAFTSLTELQCYNNMLTNIYLSANTALTDLNLNSNYLTSIDVSNNTLLTQFRCQNNQITSLDISNNTSLSLLYCFNNNLTNLDVTSNNLLSQLDCRNNSITSLALNNNPLLYFLDCSVNNIINLDLSFNAVLTELHCQENQLTSVNIQNGNNSNIVDFDATNNPALTCIQVDDVAYMNTNWATAKDVTASYDLNCNFTCPNIPMAFIANNTQLNTSNIATFNNTTPNPSQYNFVWYFGDGTFFASNSASINHTYDFNGVYSVSLLAYDTINGCSDTLYASNYITCNIAGNTACNHTVSLNPTGVINACIGSTVPITSNTSATMPYYQWNRNGASIGGASQELYFVESNGNYTLTVFDINGCPQTSAPVQINYNLPSNIPPTISTSGSPNYCGNVNMTLTANGSFSNYLWSTGQNGNSINVTQGGTYTVIGQSPACDAVSLPYLINGTNAPNSPICTITVDETDSKNIVIWEKPVTSEIDSFLILREDTALQGVYHTITSQSYNDLSEFKDNNSNANRRAYRYKLAVKDTCGGVSISSSSQRSMHLNVVMGNNILARQLTWNVYQGQPQGFDYYLIYRDFNLIDSVPSWQTWYIDNSVLQPTDIPIIYFVAYRITNPCASSARSQINFCKSNIVYHLIPSGIDDKYFNDFSFEIIPNPNNGKFKLIQDAGFKMQHLNIKIVSMLGNEVYNTNISNTKSVEIDLSNLANGVYMISVSNGVNRLNKRLVVAK